MYVIAVLGAGAAKPPAGSAGQAGRGACAGRRLHNVVQGRAPASLRRAAAHVPGSLAGGG